MRFTQGERVHYKSQRPTAEFDGTVLLVAGLDDEEPTYMVLPDGETVLCVAEENELELT